MLETEHPHAPNRAFESGVDSRLPIGQRGDAFRESEPSRIDSAKPGNTGNWVERCAFSIIIAPCNLHRRSRRIR